MGFRRKTERSKGMSKYKVPMALRMKHAYVAAVAALSGMDDAGVDPKRIEMLFDRIRTAHKRFGADVARKRQCGPLGTVMEVARMGGRPPRWA